MAGLKELRTRIEAIKSTQKITSAMKMVAASRLRRVQILVDKNQGYSENLRRSALRVKTEIEAEEQNKNIKYVRPTLLQEKKKPQKYILYVLSSDRGLCGAYNSNVAKKAIARIKELLKIGKNVKVVCIGKKGYDALKRTFGLKTFDLVRMHLDAHNLTYTTAAEKLSDSILKQFKNGDFDVCEFVYARFVSAISRNFVKEIGRAHV